MAVLVLNTDNTALHTVSLQHAIGMLLRKVAVVESAHPDLAVSYTHLDVYKRQLLDSDPRAMEALEKMKVLWDSAPTEASLAAMRVRLPGFAIPLEAKADKVTEFLLVPYFGACIHSPPPPANQIVHAISAKPLKGMRSMDAIWVHGTLSLKRADTPWGLSLIHI